MTPNIAEIPVALLAGGLATRLRPITEKIPKALVELAGAPFIDHQLALLHRNGIRNVVMCLGYRGEMVEQHCGDGARYGMKLSYAYDGDKLMGTGGAIARARSMLGTRQDDILWVMYGDSYMDIDYPKVLDAFLNAGGSTTHSQAFPPDLRLSPLGLMTVLHNGDRWDKSNVVFRNNRLLKYDKKNRTPEMDYIDYGVGLLRMNAVERIPIDRPFDLAELYTALVDEGLMIGYEVRQRFYEIGTPESLEEARRYLQSSCGATE